ncbi:tetratricopeptide repeat protein [Geoalkalibacter subterraneus]|uniref:Tetratricopeptide repeat protein n=1 Tax=Geoalkalibacter subterraneus TaxID=483547 RepID=A0A0B5FLC2_9BACT|nr:hypothetical protein [Geoalkalibacter subterraneus]AJF08198.1 hypothetical protein GSUB_17045 [Geoalkalibacter subterraneus]
MSERDTEKYCLEFIVSQDGSEGQFVEPHTDQRIKLEEEFDDLWGSFGRSGDKENTSRALRKMIKEHPDFVDAYAHLALLSMPPYSHDEFSKAARWYRQGYKVAASLIPENFNGQIDGRSFSNRPFFRIHQGLILCALWQKRFKSALPMMERHLAWDPDDRQGIRFLLGDIYLLHFKCQEARELLEETSQVDPYCWYSLGLLEFFEGNFVKALTCLRKGFARNPYIAEGLTGRNITPHSFWHPTTFGNVDQAQGYLDLLGYHLWETMPWGKDFIDWAFYCSRSLQERASFTQINEALGSAHDFETRRQVLEDEKALLSQIDDESSATWIEKIRTENGNLVWPWDKKQQERVRRAEKIMKRINNL